jgi:hypothetical protein
MEGMNENLTSKTSRIDDALQDRQKVHEHFKIKPPTRESIIAEEVKNMNAYLKEAQHEMSETQALAKWDILMVDRSHFKGPKAFSERRDQWLQAVGDPEVLKPITINRWAEVMDHAVYELHGIFEEGDLTKYKERRDEWIEAGVIPSADWENSRLRWGVLTSLLAEKVIAEEAKSRGSTEPEEAYNKRRDAYMQLGIFTEEHETKFKNGEYGSQKKSTGSFGRH